jgi:hypothetical protein
MEKQLGKLTVPQFQRIVKRLPEIREQMKELPQLVKSWPRKKAEEVFDKDFCWAAVYEFTLAEQIGLLIFALGKVQKFLEIARSPDPQEASLEWMDVDDMDDWSGGEGGIFERKHVVGLVVALQRNILSIMLYHRSLAALVDDVRSRVSQADDSFFLAVRIDRSILACPTFADRLARAELHQDSNFFRRLRAALKGPSKKHMEALKDLRYALAILRDAGFDALSDAQLEDLFVNKLKLYPRVASARKNLRKHLYESRKIATI